VLLTTTTVVEAAPLSHFHAVPPSSDGGIRHSGGRCRRHREWLCVRRCHEGLEGGMHRSGRLQRRDLESQHQTSLGRHQVKTYPLSMSHKVEPSVCRYLGTATASLLRWRNFGRPVEAMKDSNPNLRNAHHNHKQCTILTQRDARNNFTFSK